ncbi:MAG: cytosine deaminase [Gammaproteobacteria bacterium]|nr:cytosine deaminase [Gammaproteobacteria bacterium]
MLLTNVVHPRHGLTHLRIDGAAIKELGSELRGAPAEASVDAHGALILPAFVDAHTHLDKSLIGLPWHPHAAGPSVADRIHNERAVLRELEVDSAVQSERLARHMLARGTTHIRTHVDIVPEIGLRHFHGVMAAREQLRDLMHIQVVAFPQLGVTRAPGTLTLLEEALANGAEVVGGLDPISIDHDANSQLDAIFALADKYDAEVDIHLHDRGEMGATTVELIAERTHALGLAGRVVVSHAFCLGDVDAARQAALLDQLAKNDIAIMTHGPSGGVQSPPVRALHERGVRVFSGSDGVRDAWGPLNTGDMLERAFTVAYINGFRDDAGLELSLRMATYAGAQVLGLEHYGIEPGDLADFVLVDARNEAEAVVLHPPRRAVYRQGKLVAGEDFNQRA